MSSLYRKVNPGQPLMGPATAPFPHVPGSPVETLQRQQDVTPPGSSPGESSLATIRNVMLHGRPARGKLGNNIIVRLTKAQPKAVGFQELLRIVDIPPGETVTVYTAQGVIAGQINGAPITPVNGPPIVRFFVQLVTGGGTPTTGQEPTAAGSPVGLALRAAGSSVYVRYQLCSDEQGFNLLDMTPYFVLATDFISVRITGFVSPGDGEDLVPTKWVRPTTPMQVGQQVEIGSGRIQQIQGYASSANTGTVWVMFFDWPPNVAIPNGTAPLFAFPVPVGSTFSDDFINTTRFFAWGLVWAVSDTEDVLTQSTNTVRMDMALYPLPRHGIGEGPQG